MLMSLATLSSRLPAEVPSFTAMVREKEWRPLLKASWIELKIVLSGGSTTPRRLGWPPKLPKPWRRGTNSAIAMARWSHVETRETVFTLREQCTNAVALAVLGF